MTSFVEKLAQRHPEPEHAAVCQHFLNRYRSGDTGAMVWEEIEPLLPSDYVHLEDIPSQDREIGAAHVHQVAIMKLNGGLGTSMGCEGPKSLVEIFDGQTFMDCIIQQIESTRKTYQAPLPFVLMNSQFTHEATEAALRHVPHYSFLQPMYPRLDDATGDAFRYDADPAQEWYPPGHGSLYMALVSSGICDQLLDAGVEFVYVSNSDNMGASMDPTILGHMVAHQLDFLMELTPKTHLDVKGGTVVRYRGAYTLLERAQVEEAHVPDFEDVHAFPIFNTNSLWLRLRAVKARVEQLSTQLPLIVNRKRVDGRSVVQLETAMGAALSCFDRAGLLVVPRDRFIAVKHTSDLMLLQSDGIEKHDGCWFRYAESFKTNGYPSIALGPAFKSVTDYKARVPIAPSLKHVRSLSIQSDITIAPGTIFEGDVTL